MWRDYRKAGSVPEAKACCMVNEQVKFEKGQVDNMMGGWARAVVASESCGVLSYLLLPTTTPRTFCIILAFLPIPLSK